MKRMFLVLVIVGTVALLAGCVTVSQYRFALNTDTGEVRREYCDLASRQGTDEKNYSVTNDWAILKEAVADKKPEYDAEVVEDISKAFFQTNNTLCARKIQRVKCPKCFPGKAALLSYFHDKEWRFELINGEVVLFLPTSKTIVSANGQKVTTPKNSLIFWPENTTNFEYIVSEQFSGGTSLLPYYLEEEKGRK